MASRLGLVFIALLILHLQHCNGRSTTTITITVAGSARRLPTFGDEVHIRGAMARTTQQYQDGLVLDVHSPKSRTVIVQKNTHPRSVENAIGAGGASWVVISNFSYIVKMSEASDDLVAKIGLPWRSSILNSLNVLAANTFVAKLTNNNSWVIDDSNRSVYVGQNITSIAQMKSLDGEYRLVGRQTLDNQAAPVQSGQAVEIPNPPQQTGQTVESPNTPLQSGQTLESPSTSLQSAQTLGNSTIPLQFGQGPTRTMNLTGGPGTQEAEFIDGLKFSVQAPGELRVNAVIKEGVNPGTLPPTTQFLNSFMWIVNTSNPSMQLDAKMMVPFSRNMLVALKPSGSSPSTMLTVGRRALNATSGQFLPVNATQIVHELPEDRIAVTGLKQIDGQYLLLVTEPKQLTAPAP